ncbi:MAG: hypothetical protein ACXWC8_20010, partial [Limisphaerales bacterium]
MLFLSLVSLLSPVSLQFLTVSLLHTILAPRLNNKSDAVPNYGCRNKQRIEREQIYDTTQTTTKLSSIFTRTPLNR